MLSGMGKNSAWLRIPLLCLVKIVMDLWLSSMEESAFTRGLVTSHDCFSLCGVWHWLYLPIWCNFWFLPQIPREGNSQRTLLCQLLPSHLSWRFELSMLVIVIACDFHESSLQTARPPDHMHSIYCSKCRRSPAPKSMALSDGAQVLSDSTAWGKLSVTAPSSIPCLLLYPGISPQSWGTLIFIQQHPFHVCIFFNLTVFIMYFLCFMTSLWSCSSIIYHPSLTLASFCKHNFDSGSDNLGKAPHFFRPQFTYPSVMF